MTTVDNKPCQMLVYNNKCVNAGEKNKCLGTFTCHLGEDDTYCSNCRYMNKLISKRNQTDGKENKEADQEVES